MNRLRQLFQRLYWKIRPSKRPKESPNDSTWKRWAELEKEHRDMGDLMIDAPRRHGKKELYEQIPKITKLMDEHGFSFNDLVTKDFQELVDKSKVYNPSKNWGEPKHPLRRTLEFHDGAKVSKVYELGTSKEELAKREKLLEKLRRDLDE